MLHIPILRTRRLTVQLRELTIGESIALANMPPNQFEAECTSFLRKAVDSVKGIPDPADWTVQERMLAVCQYLAATLPGGPDFPVGDGHYSDYLDGAKDYPPDEFVDAGEVGGDKWMVRHLTGAMAETIERLEGEVEGADGRLHWMLGCMAAQLVMVGEDVISPSNGEGVFDEFVVGRMRTLLAYPENDFTLMLIAFSESRKKLDHLFHIDYTKDGLVALPKGGDATELPPARFPVGHCLSKLAKELARKPE